MSRFASYYCDPPCLCFSHCLVSRRFRMALRWGHVCLACKNGEFGRIFYTLLYTQDSVPFFFDKQTKRFFVHKLAFIVFYPYGSKNVYFVLTLIYLKMQDGDE